MIFKYKKIRFNLKSKDKYQIVESQTIYILKLNAFYFFSIKYLIRKLLQIYFIYFF